MRVIRDRPAVGARTGPAIGLFSRPGRAFFSKPGNAHGISYALRSFSQVRGCGRFSTSRTHLPFRFLTPASFIVPGSVDQGAIGGGFWGLAPRTSRAVRSVGPAKAFAHRAEQIHQP